jgi:hypothetical protein
LIPFPENKFTTEGILNERLVYAAPRESHYAGMAQPLYREFVTALALQKRSEQSSK